MDRLPASLACLATSFLFLGLRLMTPGPWTQPPMQAIPSMKFSGSTPLDIFSRASLHSSMPLHATVLASTELPRSLRPWATAAATPPPAAKARP